MPLSGGQHLFFACTGSVFKRETSFTNQFIGSFQIVFETYMSVAEARAISLSEILKTTAKELDMLNADLLFIRQLQSDSLRKVAKEDPKKFSLIANANCLVFPSSQELEASSCFKFSKTLRALRLSRSIARIRQCIK